ncbi:MAG TPA: MarR family transcriptional regulator [Candidatus Udaeobacter sp.]|nr:MarR family transcriptional regulator [Candidatus Udaeobacter sp.]
MAAESDWTDSLLQAWSDLAPGFRVEPYEVTARISRLALHIGRHQEQVFARFGLNRGDVGVLSALRIAGPPNQLSPTRLFKGLMLSSAGITSRLDRLERLGMVRRTRHPNDRRGILVELTEEGRSVLDRAVRASADAEGELVAGLEPGELRELAALLKKMLSRFE